MHPPIQPSTPTYSTQNSNTTTTQKNNTVRSSATVTNEEQETYKAQQAASKTTIPTRPKSRHYTHIMTISSNKHKQRTVTNHKQHKSMVPHDSTKGTHKPRTTNTCTYHPCTHTPCTHAHTNKNPSDQAHPPTHKNDTNSCKMCEFHTKFVTTTFTVPVFEALWGRISYEISTKFARISYEFRSNFAGHWQSDTYKAPNNTTYACNEVPTPTHISVYMPPLAHTHTHTHIHTHTYPYTRYCCCRCCGPYIRRPRSPLTRRRIIPF